MKIADLKILVVDDNQDNLTSVKAVVKETFPSALVLTAMSGAAGIEMALAEDPDLILLDIIMPGMDGYEVCRRLKGDDFLRHIPVVFFTALKTSRESRIKALEVGAEAFLSKPLDEIELTAQIRAMARIKAANLAQVDEKKQLARSVEQKTRELRRAHTATLNLLEDLKAENEARMKTDLELRSSLAEKEVLLKEVHHRVKNNLMTIIGLIKMQEEKAKNSSFSGLLQELEGRIYSIAQVHESLYKSKDLARIDLQNYIDLMVNHICAQFGRASDILFSIQATVAEADLDIAVPFGLILNELITNACKHAFPGGKPHAGEDKCKIDITLKRAGGVVSMTVADNGVGLPAGVSWKETGTLGLRLIQMLARQINGTIEVEQTRGATFHLSLPLQSR